MYNRRPRPLIKSLISASVEGLIPAYHFTSESFKLRLSKKNFIFQYFQNGESFLRETHLIIRSHDFVDNDKLILHHNLKLFSLKKMEKTRKKELFFLFLAQNQPMLKRLTSSGRNFRRPGDRLDQSARAASSLVHFDVTHRRLCLTKTIKTRKLLKKAEFCHFSRKLR